VSINNSETLLFIAHKRKDNSPLQYVVGIENTIESRNTKTVYGSVHEKMGSALLLGAELESASLISLKILKGKKMT
jgi:hypothetical protein